ncbi:MAG: S8 family serine peptidase, partial [Acidimicrobiales bacterium]
SLIPLVHAFPAAVAGPALADLARSDAVRAVTADRSGRFSSMTDDAPSTASSFPVSTGATSAWRGGDLGAGVGVAVIDTGVSAVGDLAGGLVQGPDLSGEGSPVDTYGHGTVMAGIIAGRGADSATDAKGAFVGMAPGARVISVKTAGADGATDVSTVLAAMSWVSASAAEHNIRVVNLAWGTPSTQNPTLDPLNQAVERLWAQGIVVVVAAGNAGPGPSTVTKPGDDPMVITVGAYDDRGDANPANDKVPSWSSRGPTAAGVAKPDLVAPGRTLISTRSPGSTVERENAKALVGASYIKGSGTSQASAVTSGAAALLLAAHPSYTPDQVKAVLTATALTLTGPQGAGAGSGRLRVGEALVADPGPARWQPASATAPGAPGDPNWTGSSWTGSSWTGSSWTGSSWTGSSWTSAFWGDRPRASQHLPGEASAPD